MLSLPIFVVLVKRLLSAANPPRRHLLLLILAQIAQFVDFSLASFSSVCADIMIPSLDRHLCAEAHINGLGSRINRLEGLLIWTCRH